LEGVAAAAAWVAVAAWVAAAAATWAELQEES